ncbi:hypothetical protein ACQVE0_005414 [Escherichia coli]|nr:hypothetical protein [Escherichia coli]
MKEAILDRAANLSCASWLKEHLQQPEKNAAMSSLLRFTIIAGK